jgi:capsular polysaccharide transport system permease protein
MIKVPEKVGGLPVLFVATVLIPTILAAIFLFFKSDVYTSESRFVVQSSDKKEATGLSALIKSSGFNAASEEGFAANSYILSRDALATLDRDGLISRTYSDPNVSVLDRFNPFGSGGGRERLFKYYEDMVTVKFDTASGITTMEVKAFDPVSARQINARLLSQAEALVNRMNMRGREDVINYANAELAEAKQQAQNAAVALSAFRNREGIVDPEKQATVQLQMISKLQDEMIATKTQLVLLRSLTPQNPQVPVLATRINELNREINTQSGLVAGDQKSLAASAVQFQRLQLESQLADKVLAAAISSLLDAKNEARRKQAYVSRIVEPSFPDNRSGPKRLRGVLNVLVVGLVLWAIMSMILAGVREHTE